MGPYTDRNQSQMKVRRNGAAVRITQFVLSIATLLIILPNVLSAQTQLITSIDTTRGYIGDVFHLRLTIDHPKQSTVQYPADIKNLGEFSVRDIKGEPDADRTTIEYAIAAYDTGDHVIPPLSIQVQPPDSTEKPLTFRSDSLHIVILSLVPPDAQGLKDIKPLMEIPGTISWLWILAALLLVLILGGVFWWWKRRTPTEAEPEMTPEERRQSAHERAYARLREIEQKQYPQKGAMKDHFSEVSETIRAYFEDRYFIPALEMTSTEVLRAFPEDKFHPELHNQVSDLLTTADLVKFAKYTASLDEAERVVLEAYHIVDETKIDISEQVGEETNLAESEDTSQVIAESKGESP